ncbi:hypothetical protein PsorP6_010993 [Peronosclerospora sorghi]|uniref:Uncharacterized protein n=1 Tax=Peronosclerospora sorghi TaxID=230839 RepID=A0ACC0VU14_9STRA|nr:hypothetical protein PsorP6_010993 [Peronosclerospora sorghi]
MEANDTPFKEDGGVLSDDERYFRHCTVSKDNDRVEGDDNSDRDALFAVLVGKAQVTEKVRNMDVTDEDEEETDVDDEEAGEKEIKSSSCRHGASSPFTLGDCELGLPLTTEFP